LAAAHGSSTLPSPSSAYAYSPAGRPDGALKEISA
jgi:hypothetical protein